MGLCYYRRKYLLPAGNNVGIDKKSNRWCISCANAPLSTNFYICFRLCRIDDARKNAYATVNDVMVKTYWNVGKHIVDHEQNGEKRAEYGKQLLKMLSKEQKNS